MHAYQDQVADDVPGADKTSFDAEQDLPKINIDVTETEEPVPPPMMPTRARHRTAHRSFHVIANKDEQKTFIDADCRLDHEFYPLYPNNKTSFVLKPGDKVTNFGLVGFPATNQTETGTGPNKGWKIVRRRCLGVMRCSNILCTFLSAPPTGIGKLRDKLSQ